MSASIKNVEEYIGKTYGDRTIIGVCDSDKSGHVMVMCRCKCGKESKVYLSKLLHGEQTGCKSCHSSLLKHGLKGNNIKLYECWQHMKRRCLSSYAHQYNDYGGRGIKICDEWVDNFSAFYEWALANGYREDLTIDRIDVNGNYEPSNCRWVNMTIQNINRRIQKSNTTGYEGIDYHPELKKNKWKARICMYNKRVYLGLLDTLKEALEARNNYIKEHNLPHKIQEYVGEIGTKTTKG